MCAIFEGGVGIEVWPVLVLGGVGVLKVLWVGIGIIGIEVWCGIGGVEWAYLIKCILKYLLKYLVKYLLKCGPYWWSGVGVFTHV